MPRVQGYTLAADSSRRARVGALALVATMTASCLGCAVSLGATPAASAQAQQSNTAPASHGRPPTTSGASPNEASRRRSTCTAKCGAHTHATFTGSPLRTFVLIVHRAKAFVNTL